MGHILSSRGTSETPQKVDKMWDWPISTNAKEVYSFLGLASYYQRFIPKFAQFAPCLQELVGSSSTKTKKIRGQNKEILAANENPIETKNLNGCQNINMHLMH